MAIALHRAATSAHEVEDQEGHYQQQMNQASSDVKAETQEPENQENNEDRPQHVESFLHIVGTPGFDVRAYLSELLSNQKRISLADIAGYAGASNRCESWRRK